MTRSPSERKVSFRGPWFLVATTAYLAACLGPYLIRLLSPSLYADDIVRIAQLQTTKLTGMLFQPFNEHLAPLFQVVSWVSWQLAGRSLARAPLAFTLASFLPFVLVLNALGGIIRRETRSGAVALAGLAIFSLSSLSQETVYWYSASSFMWALLCTLLAWLAMARASDRPTRASRRFDLALAALAASAAPAFSAIGLLAGPFAAIPALGGRGRRSDALAPAAGTLFFLGLCGVLHHSAAVATSIERNSGIVPGVLASVRAPFAALVPGLVGLSPRTSSGASDVVLITLTLAFTTLLLVEARRNRDARALILGGLLLIFGGYTLTFCARAGETGRGLLETQRYHLFPMAGFVLLLAPFLRRILGRCDSRPLTRLWIAAALAATLLVLHDSRMRAGARFLHYRDQTQTLAALDRLGVLCARHHITRDQALATLDPIEFKWTPPGYSALLMLPPGATTPALPDSLVKPTLLNALTPAERRSVCGGMDVTRYLQRADSPDLNPEATVSVARPVTLYRVRDEGQDRYVAAGWPAFIEFEFQGSDPASARALEMSAFDPSQSVEVWWRGDRQRWSETRSVRFHSDATLCPSARGWLLPLDRLPHWDPSEARRLRLLFHAPGPLAVASPRLIR
ncbi:MAG: hypothetical protein NVSMB9_23140 [Isosphaeraceae bacterium]